MSTENKNVIFTLVNTQATTYQKADGSFVDKPVSRRLMMEYNGYAKINGEQKFVEFRHIRAQKSFVKNEQDAAASFNPKADNIFFINGLCIVSEIEAVTIAALRAHKDNEANADLYPNQTPVFKEVNAEKDAKIDLDTDRYAARAMNVIYDLYDDFDGEVKVKDQIALAILSYIFQTSLDLGINVQLAELKNKAKSDPVNFLFLMDKGFNDVLGKINQAIEEGVIVIDKDQSAKFGDVEIVSLKGVKEKEHNKMLIYSLISTPSAKALFEEINTAVHKKLIS